MNVTAKLRNAPLSPQKGRLVADMVRRKDIASALEILQFTPKKGAFLIKKLLNSVIANAENNHGADIEELIIKTICVDEAPSMKRIMPRAKGRANRIVKRACHITIIVSDEV